MISQLSLMENLARWLNKWSKTPWNKQEIIGKRKDDDFEKKNHLKSFIYPKSEKKNRNKNRATSKRNFRDKMFIQEKEVLQSDIRKKMRPQSLAFSIDDTSNKNLVSLGSKLKK